MKNYFSKRKFNIIFSAASVLLMLLIWVIAYYSVRNDYLIPSVTDTVKSLFACFASGTFWVAFLNTLLRVLIAFIVSFALAALIAVPCIFSKAAEAFFKPFMVLFRTLPTLAIVLILLIWTNPKVAPVVVTVLVLFPVIYSQIMAAFGGVDKEVCEMAQVYQLKPREKLSKIYIPQILPDILSQTGANFSLGIKVMVSAEVLSVTYRSLGGLMQNARLYSEMPRLAALTLIAVVLGLVFDVAFSQLERITYKWRGRSGN